MPDERINQNGPAPENPGIVQPTNKQVQRAVRNYLANELGIGQEYVDGVLRGIVASRNIDGIIESEIRKYFHKGPDGWNAEQIVRERVVKRIDEQLRLVMDGGVRDRIKSVVDGHVNAIAEAASMASTDSMLTGRDWVLFLSKDALLDAFAARVPAELEYARFSDDGFVWNLQAKASKVRGDVLAAEVTRAFSLVKEDVTHDYRGLVQVRPAAMPKVMAILFPGLRYDASLPKTDGVVLMGPRKDTLTEENPDDNDKTDTKEER